MPGNILFYEGGTQWWCTFCDETIRKAKDGSGECRCLRELKEPDQRANAYETVREEWKPVCGRCPQVKKTGFRRLFSYDKVRIPFTNEHKHTVALPFVVVEWFTGNAETDVSNVPERETWG